MHRPLQYIFFLGIFLISAACTKNEFKLQFELSKEVTENYNVTYYATDTKGGLTVQAVASVREGKCELKGVTKKPTLVSITTRKSNYPLVVYAEKGKEIVITGDNGEPLTWEIGENQINEDLSSWRIENIKLLDGKDAEKVNGAVKKFVEANEDNPASLILLQFYYDRQNNESEYVKLMTSLNDALKDEEWKRIIGNPDFMLMANNYPARLESIIMRSQNASADTLMINEKNPVFLMFWQTGDSDNKNFIDSIKKLVKEYPDSSRLLADVCLDIDSMAWRNAIRRDSLDEKQKRFWVPTGMADPTMMKLKVNSIPYYIVFNKKGEQSYRGTELGDAMKEYRKLQKTKEK